MSTVIRPVIQLNAGVEPCNGSSFEDDPKSDHDAGQRRRGLLLITASCLIALALSLALFKSASAAILGGSTSSGSSSQSHSSTQGLGYWLVASDGGIFSEGGAPFTGSTGGMVLNKAVVGMAATPDGNGYWLVASDGGIFNYGDATFEGSAGNLPSTSPSWAWRRPRTARVTGSSPPTAGIFNYGDAQFYGSAGNLSLNKPIVGMAATPDGKGYWLVASDGGIFSYGDAQFYGSTGGMTLNKPIVGMASHSARQGLLAGGLRRRHLQLRRRAVLRLHGQHGTQQAHRGHGGHPGRQGLLAGGLRRRHLQLRRRRLLRVHRRHVDEQAHRRHGTEWDVRPRQQVGLFHRAGRSQRGTAFSTQPVVTVEDAAGDPVTTDNSTVTIGIAPGTPTSGGPGVLSTCTSTGENNGVFTFGGCVIDSAGTGYKLIATDGQLASATSAPFAVGTGPATHIAFTTEPDNAIGGSVFVTQPRLTIEDAGGNTVTADTHGIALAINSGPGGALSGCSATNTGGAVSFSGCSINMAGSYALRATDAGDGFTTTSSSFDVGTGVPSQLVFTTEPGGATGGTAFTAQPTVAIEDAGGNTVTGDTHAITLARTAGSGTLSGCASTTTAGVAVFSGCTINTTGTGDILTATDAGDTLGAPSSAFNVTVGTPSQLVFTTEPGGATGGTAFTAQPTVAIEDAGGNTVTGDTHAITLARTAGSGTLSGCASTTTAGVAVFSGCTINTAGTGDILTATDGGDILSAPSSAFNVTVGTPSQLAFTTEPSPAATGGTAFTTEPAVTVEDAGGNTVTTDSSTVTLTANGGTGVITGCSQTETDGVVAYSGCSINTDGTYTITAADSTLTTASSGSIVVGTGVPAQLVFTTEPAGATGGSAFATQPVVTVEDAGGNTVTDDATVPALTLTTGPGTLSGCTTSTAAGVTTFSGCTIDSANSGDILTATDTADSLTNTSSSFDVTVGVPAQLVFTIQPGAATAGSAFVTQPTVTIEDAGGNTVTTDTSSITMAMASGPGTLSGCTSTTTAGVAAFSGCSIDTAGEHMLAAHDETEGVNNLSDEFDVTG